MTQQTLFDPDPAQKNRTLILKTCDTFEQARDFGIEKKKKCPDIILEVVKSEIIGKWIVREVLI